MAIFLCILGALTIVAVGMGLVLRPRGANPFARDRRSAPRPSPAQRLHLPREVEAGAEYDVIVVGSGIGGLGCAVTLARAGRRVLVLEQHSRPGGCCHTWSQGGFEFETGLHFVGLSEPVDRFVFDQLTEGQVSWVRLPAERDCVHVRDTPSEPFRSYPVNHVEWQTARASLRDHFPAEQAAVDAFMSLCTLERCAKTVDALYLLKLVPRWLARTLLGLRLVRPPIRTTVSLEAGLAALTSDRDLARVLASGALLYAGLGPDDPYDVGALYLGFCLDAHYPVGGPDALPRALIPVIERAGGAVVVGQRVARIVERGGRGVGVTLAADGRFVAAADAVVVAGGVALLHRLLERPPPELPRSSGYLELHVGLRGSPASLGLTAQQQLLLTGSTLRDLAVAPAAPAPPPMLFVSAGSAKDPASSTRQPDKTSLVVVGLPASYDWFARWRTAEVRRRGEDYRALKERLTAAMWQPVLEIYPQLEGQVEFMDLSTPLTAEHFLGTDRGAIYGLHASPARFARPGLLATNAEAAGIRGVFLTGQDLGLHGIFGALMAGIGTAGVVLGRNTIADLRALFRRVEARS